MSWGRTPQGRLFGVHLARIQRSGHPTKRLGLRAANLDQRLKKIETLVVKQKTERVAVKPKSIVIPSNRDICQIAVTKETSVVLEQNRKSKRRETNE